MVNRKEPKQINFRVSEEEFLRLSEMATNSKMTIGGFCKNNILGIKTVKPSFDKETGQNIYYELRKLGNNVNQLAKAKNHNQNISFDKVKLIIEEISNELWRLLNLKVTK